VVEGDVVQLLPLLQLPLPLLQLPLSHLQLPLQLLHLPCLLVDLAFEHGEALLLLDDGVGPSNFTDRQAPLQCPAMQQYGATLVNECSEAGDKIGRTHVIEGVICYSWPVVPYNIGFYLPEATCRALGLIVTVRP
jgi:hypothetical protein